MTKIKTLKDSYLNLKENFSRIITGKEVWSRYMDRLIEEAEEKFEYWRIYNTWRIKRGVNKRI